jgi:hypothetical protein
LHLHCLAPPESFDELQLACAGLPGDVSATQAPASPEATWRALRACDMVWLPHDFSTVTSRVRGAGSLVEALRGGRFAVASPLPAYAELSQYAYVGDSSCVGILWALRHPLDVVSRISQGQRMVAEQFSAQAVARRWLEALGTEA